MTASLIRYQNKAMRNCLFALLILCIHDFALAQEKVAMKPEGDLQRPRAKCIALLGFTEYEPKSSARPHVYSDPCLFPLFEKSETGWKSIDKPTGQPDLTTWRVNPALPNGKNWWFFFDGKVVDKIKGISVKVVPVLNEPYETTCFDASSNPKLTKILNDRSESGLNLLATTNPDAKDVAMWRRTQLPGDILRKAKAEFIKKFSYERKCVPEKDDPGLEKVVISKTKLKDSMIDVDSRSFVSNRAEYLIGLEIPKKKQCHIGVGTEIYLQKHWYSVSKNSVAEVAAENIFDSLPSSPRQQSPEPIEAGDFDGDGETEWIFRYASGTFGLLDHRFKLLTFAGTAFPGVPGDGY